MTLQKRDLESKELLWILMALIKLLRMLKTKSSKTIKLLRLESTRPKVRLRQLWMKRDKLSLMLLI